MSKEEADVKFKVEDVIIPAHKQVLIGKSKYFANLFKSILDHFHSKLIPQ